MSLDIQVKYMLVLFLAYVAEAEENASLNTEGGNDFSLIIVLI